MPPDYHTPTTKMAQIVALLQGSRRWSPQALADHMGVGKRSIYRNLNRLRAAGVPVRYDPDSGGYVIEGDTPPNPAYAVPVPAYVADPRLTPDEVAALGRFAAAAVAADVPLTPRAGSALRKLGCRIPPKPKAKRPRIIASMNFDLPNVLLEKAWGIANAGPHRHQAGGPKSRWRGHRYRDPLDDPACRQAFERECRIAAAWRRRRRPCGLTAPPPEPEQPRPNL